MWGEDRGGFPSQQPKNTLTRRQIETSHVNSENKGVLVSTLLEIVAGPRAQRLVPFSRSSESSEIDS